MLIIFWWLGSSTGTIPQDVLPSPGVMVTTFAELVSTGQLIEALAVSLRRVFFGFAIGFSLGVAASLVSGLFRAGEDLLDAPIQMLRTLPWAGLVPLFIIWFGIDEAPKIALVALAVFFPIYLNLYAGIRNVDQTLVEAAQTLGLGRLQMIRYVILPGALPNGLVGLRYALGGCWLALVFAETVNSQAGIGYLTTYAREIFRTDIIMVCLVVYAGLGIAADFIVRTLEKRFLSWRPSFSGV